MAYDQDSAIKLYQEINAVGETEVRKMAHWHASSLADCPRAHMLKRLGEGFKSSPGAGKQLRWKAGHAFEEAVRDYIPALFDPTEEVLTNERYISEKLDLTGEYDNFAVNSGTLVEIKTVHDYAFIERDKHTYLKEHDGIGSNGKNKWKPKMEPHLNHQIQQHAYVLLLRERGYEVTEIKYVYISLSGRLCVYTTEVDPTILANVTKRLEVLNKAWATQELPDCICEPSHPLWDSTMQFCNYRTELDCCLVGAHLNE